jgi:ATP-dependent Zn protease
VSATPVAVQHGVRRVVIACRFDRSIEVRRPDYQGRLEGIKVHLREKPIANDIDYAELATLTGGMSGAQLAGEMR